MIIFPAENHAFPLNENIHTVNNLASEPGTELLSKYGTNSSANAGTFMTIASVFSTTENVSQYINDDAGGGNIKDATEGGILFNPSLSVKGSNWCSGGNKINITMIVGSNLGII